MKKRKIKIEDAVGMIFPHDLTKVVPGKFKGRAFRKGSRIRRSDIPALLKIGKEKIWVLDLSSDECHEDEAAAEFRKISGSNIGVRGPEEGCITFFAKKNGLLLVDAKKVAAVNRVRDVVLATKHSRITVKKGEDVAGIRIVPLATAKKNVRKVLKIAGTDGIFSVKPFVKKRCALIITGSEVAKGRIKDRFAPVVRKKLKKFGSTVAFFRIVTDSEKLIRQAILEAAEKCNLIILTGGMSVDPDDVTRLAVKRAGARVASYGAPVLPGNMFLAAYLKDIPILGVPAGAIFFETTVFDLFLPEALADVKITRKDVLSRGYGGFCAHCRVCVFPDCQFGKC